MAHRRSIVPLPPERYVYIVDDDPACRESIALLLELKGIAGVPCASGEAFFASYVPDATGCVLLDFRMPAKNGLEVQAEIIQRGLKLPIVMLSAHGDVATTRNALKSGAFDFLEKPIDTDQLLTTVALALERDAAQLARAQHADEVSRRLARLTQREAEVMKLVVAGLHNREIGSQLGISPRTVEVYKARLMLKLETDRIPDLIRLVAGNEESDPTRAS